MKKLHLLILAGLIFACVSVYAIAQPRGGRGYGANRMQGGRPGMQAEHGVEMILRLKEQLDLTEGQVSKLEAIEVEVKAGNEAVQTKRNTLQEAVQSKATENAIRTIATELGKALGDQAVLQVRTKTKLDGILTSAQKVKLEELRRPRGMNRDEQGQGRRGRGDSAGAWTPEAAFARIDSDGDGSISPDEYTSHIEQMRERIGGEGLRERGGSRGQLGRRPR